MKKFKFFIITLTLLIFWGCADKPTETTTLGNVHGTVFDQSNNSELADVSVSIQDIGNRTTNNNGYYEFKDLAEDTYTITAEKTGYVTESAQVEIEANKSKEVNFTLHTAQPAQLIVSPTSLNFGQTGYNLNISINNGGDEELSWQVSSDQSWLTTFPSTGTTTTETDEITATVNRAGLEVGNYSGNLSFTSNGGDFNVPVQMEVTPVVLIINPNSLDFGSEETQLTFTISNTGNGELNWSLTPNQNWIAATPTTGSLTNSSEDVTVTIDRTGLEPNTYKGSISVESNAGNQNVSITMIVPEGPAPVLEVSTTSLDFGSEEDQLSFNIINSGEATLNWDISDNQDWLFCYPTSGSTNPSGTTTINVSVDRTGLSFGSYNGAINITSNGGNETISVLMSVPFLDTFENLDNWDYIGWAISSFGSCPTQPCARWGSENGTNYLKMNINVESGQILSFWVYINGYDTTLNLYINNVSMWSYNTPFGSGTFSIPLSESGNTEIKFVGETNATNAAVYLDNVAIE